MSWAMVVVFLAGTVGWHGEFLEKENEDVGFLLIQGDTHFGLIAPDQD